MSLKKTKNMNEKNSTTKQPNEKQTLLCEKCKKVYCSQKTLSKHKCLFCSECEKIFSSHQRKLSHKCSKSSKGEIKQLSHENEFQTTELSTSTKQNYDFGYTHQSHKVRSFCCESCKKVYKSEKTFTNHKCLFCSDCKKIFSSFQRKIGHNCSKINIENPCLETVSQSKPDSGDVIQSFGSTSKTVSKKNKIEKSSLEAVSQSKPDRGDVIQSVGSTSKTVSKKNKIEKSSLETVSQSKPNRGDVIQSVGSTSKTVSKKNNIEKSSLETVSQSKPDRGDVIQSVGSTSKTVSKKNNIEKSSLETVSQSKPDRGDVIQSVGSTSKTVSKKNKIEKSSLEAVSRSKPDRGDVIQSVGSTSKTVSKKNNIEKSSLEAVSHLISDSGEGVQSVSSTVSKTDCIETKRSYKQRSFQPIDLNWQVEKCVQLNIPLVHGHSFTSSQLPISRPYSVKNIIGDGNCFFRALSYIITGDENYHQPMRRHIIKHLEDNPRLFSPALIFPESVIDYVRRSNMNRNGTWATENEIIIAAHLLKTNICIYTKIQDLYKWIMYTGKVVDHNLQITNQFIYLNHARQNHYEVVLSTQESQSVLGTEQNQIETALMSQILHQAKMSSVSNPISKPHVPLLHDGKVNKMDWKEKPSDASDKMIETCSKWTLYKRKQRQQREFRDQEIQNKKKTLNFEHQQQHKKQKRQSEEYRKEEMGRKKVDHEHHKLHMKRKRQSEAYRKGEIGRKKVDHEHHKLHMKRKRQSEAYRKEEIGRKKVDHEHHKLHMKRKRQSEAYRKEEVGRKKVDHEHHNFKLHMKRKRQSEAYRKGEIICKKVDYEHQRQHKKQKQESEEYRKEEMGRKKVDHEHHKLHMKRKRQSEAYRKGEIGRKNVDHEHHKLHMKWKRQSEEYRKKEMGRKKVDYKQHRLHMKRKRESEEYKLSEKQKKLKICTPEDVISNFHKIVSLGPNFICTCCDQMWYRHSVRVAKNIMTQKKELLEKCVTGVVSADNKEWICNTCYRSLQNGKLPSLAKANHNVFPNKPCVLDLTNLEERLVAVRIPFMQLHELPRGGQISLHGNVVNVPTNVNTTVSVLPRRPDDSATIPLKLKRKLSYKHYYQYQTVRPNKVIDAVNWLVENSKLYRQEGVHVNSQWSYNNDKSSLDSEDKMDTENRNGKRTTEKSDEKKDLEKSEKKMELEISDQKKDSVNSDQKKDSENRGQKKDSENSNQKKDSENRGQKKDSENSNQKKDSENNGQKKDSENGDQKKDSENGDQKKDPESIDQKKDSENSENCDQIKDSEKGDQKKDSQNGDQKKDSQNNGQKNNSENSDQKKELDNSDQKKDSENSDQKRDFENNCQKKECENSGQKNDSKNGDENKDQHQSESDKWDETTEENLPSGTMDTMMQNVLEESRQILSLAPGEGGKPLSLFLDKHAEELSFPTIFCGEERVDNKDREVPVYYSDLCKSELRRTDRRVASNVPNLFFKTKKLQMQHIIDKTNLCLRKTKGKQELTAGQLKSRENVEELIRTDEGYRVFKELRGSPPYWEKVKRDLFALIRQLNIPTWFASFSCAETKWEHLLKILGQTVDNKTYTSEEIQAFTWQHKRELIQKDLVTCGRHFDYAVQAFIHKVLKNELNPIGEIIDFFYKVEFQMRGSPHIHMLIWTNGAPQMDKDKTEDILKFIDNYVTCAKSTDIPELIERQQHAHSRTCKKQNKAECRFGFPMPPLSTTQILEPLSDDVSSTEKKKYEGIWKKIVTALNDKNMNESMTFKEFLQHLQTTEEEYIKGIESSLKTKKVFLKREVDEVRVNNYNETLLRCWRANMDLQFILDPYACAMYVISYIAKSQRGMSNLLHNACQEARNGNQDLKKQVQTIGHKFLTNVEVSAQEAVYLTLQIPLYKASRDVIFVNIHMNVIGLRAELSTNVNVEDGLANGASCVVKSLQLDERTRKPTYIWVQFDSDIIGLNLRNSSRHLYKKQIPALWTPIAQVKRQFKVGRYKTAEVMRCQFPLRPASAKTAHRCQGDTLKSAVLNFEGHGFPHAHYVALSRVKSLDQLYVTTLNEKNISVSHKVMEEMKRLNNNKILRVSDITALNGKFRLIFQNVRSLHKHFEDIHSDPFYTSWDILLFVEARLSPSDDMDHYQLPGYHFTPFIFCTKDKACMSSYGIAVYSKTILPADSVQNVQLPSGIEYTVLSINSEIGKLVVVALYVSPGTTFKVLQPVILDIKKRINILQPSKTIICGDFNIDLLKHKHHQILEKMNGYSQKIESPTTDYNSLIDHLYSDLDDKDASFGVWESYFSDHKPLWSVIH